MSARTDYPVSVDDTWRLLVSSSRRRCLRRPRKLTKALRVVGVSQAAREALQRASLDVCVYAQNHRLPLNPLQRAPPIRFTRRSISSKVGRMPACLDCLQVSALGGCKLELAYGPSIRNGYGWIKLIVVLVMVVQVAVAAVVLRDGNKYKVPWSVISNKSNPIVLQMY